MIRESDILDHPELFASGPRLVAPPGPIANAPAASAANLGLMYLETGDPLWPNGRLWVSRYNGNMINNGLTALSDVVKPTRNIVTTSDFELELRFYADPTDAVPYTGLFCSGSGSGALLTQRALWIERSNLTTTYTVKVHDSAGTAKTITVTNVTSGYWHSLKVKRVGDILTAYLDGVQNGVSVDLTGFTINAATDSSLFSHLTRRSFQGRVCCVKLTSATNGFAYDYNQSSGITIPDVSGNGNNGTLTDADPTDFWKIGWTPAQWK